MLQIWSERKRRWRQALNRPGRLQERPRYQSAPIAAALVMGLGIAFRPIMAQSCHAADSNSASMLHDLQQMADTGNTEYPVVRAKLHIPVVPAAQVVLVSDDSTCTRARQALDSLIHATNPNAANPLPARPLYVIKVGSVTAVNDPNGRAGEYTPIDFFDPQWSFLGTIAY
jgi:hypothetical protein